HHVDARGVALLAEAGAHRAEVVGAGQVALDQIGQGQILEHEVEKLFLGYLEDKIILPFTGVGCFAAATGSSATPFRTGHACAGGEVPVAGKDPGLAPPGTMVEDRLVYIPRRYADLLSTLDVGNGAPADRLFHGFLDVRLVATQAALAVDPALVLPVQSTVGDITHGPPAGSAQPSRPSL